MVAWVRDEVKPSAPGDTPPNIPNRAPVVGPKK